MTFNILICLSNYFHYFIPRFSLKIEVFLCFLSVVLGPASPVTSVQVDKTRLSGQKESDTAEVTGGGRAKPLIFDKKLQK